MQRRYAGSAVRGIFQLGSDPEPPRDESPTFLGGSLPVFKPSSQYSCNATEIAHSLAAQRAGSLTYVYLTLGCDTALVDAVADAVAKAAPSVRLVGHRELIALARQKQSLRP